MGKILGIDLGTTNSAMAVMEGGEPTILINAEAEAAANFLALTNLAGALLQGTNLEHVRIIPTLAQCGM